MENCRKLSAASNPGTFRRPATTLVPGIHDSLSAETTVISITSYKPVTLVLMRALFPEKPNFSYNP